MEKLEYRILYGNGLYYLQRRTRFLWFFHFWIDVEAMSDLDDIENIYKNLTNINCDKKVKS